MKLYDTKCTQVSMLSLILEVTYIRHRCSNYKFKVILMKYPFLLKINSLLNTKHNTIIHNTAQTHNRHIFSAFAGSITNIASLGCDPKHSTCFYRWTGWQHAEIPNRNYYFPPNIMKLQQYSCHKIFINNSKYFFYEICWGCI